MSIEEEFLLKWNNHQINFISAFKDWLIDESFVDVTLVCGGEAVLGHKVVLAACSPLLNRILHDNPCQHPVVILNDVCSADMKSLLKFIYQGEVSVSQNDLSSFLRTADNLQIKGLADDKEKEDKKRKDKEGESMERTRKKRKTDFKISSQCSQIHTVYSDSVSSDLKMQKHFVANKDKFNLNSQSSCSVVHLKTGNQSAVNSDTVSYNLETKPNTGSQAAENLTENETLGSSLDRVHATFQNQQHSSSNHRQTTVHHDISTQNFTVVKMEPLDYMGEVVWEEGKSHLQKENEQFGKAVCNASSSNSLSHQTDPGTQPFSAIPPLENLSNCQPTEFMLKNLESVQSEDKITAGKEIASGNEDISQGSVSNLEEGGEEENMLSMSSPLKFRGGRKPCCFCGKTFCDNYTLRRHMVTHLSRQRQFECSLCLAAYSRKDHLMAHIRRKHPAEEYEIEVVTKPIAN